MADAMSFAVSKDGIEAIWFDEERNRLTVRFEGKPTLYHYTPRPNVSLTARAAFGELMRLASTRGKHPGQWLNAHVKPNFDFTKEDPRHGATL